MIKWEKWNFPHDLPYYVSRKPETLYFKMLEWFMPGHLIESIILPHTLIVTLSHAKSNNNSGALAREAHAAEHHR